MKIAFIGQKGIPMKFGGIEKHVEHLAVGLAARGHKVTVYTRPWYTDKKIKSFRGVKLVSLKSLKTKHLDAISHTFLATMDVLKKDYDIVHYHGVGPALLAWIPKLFKLRTKVITTFHCIDRQHQKWGLLARMALYLGEWMAVNFAHDTITVSKVLQNYCADKFNADTIYISNGVEVHNPLPADVIKKKYGLVKDSYILFFSRLVRHKGAHHLIEAYNKIKTNKKLVIAGAPAFTEDYLRSLKRQASANPSIIFTGNVPGESREWSELYSNASLFVHPSESEGLPIVVLEALSFGLPVLVSNIPENMEAIGGRFGFSFQTKNVKDLAEKLQYLLDSPQLARAVSGDAREYVRNNFSWVDIVDSVEKLYSDVLGAKIQPKVHSKKFAT